MPSQSRRAIDLLRGAVAQARHVRARADAIVLARRSLAMSNAEGLIELDDEARRHIAEGRLVMGRESYVAPVVRWFQGDTGRVFVANFVSIARGVEVYCGGMHRTDWVSQYPIRGMLDMPGAYEDGSVIGRGDIHIGGDAWLAQGAVVMSGLTIGPGAVVAARAVVTRDVAPYAIVGGVPAKRIGRRFSDEQVAALLRIAWWEWPTQTVRERVSSLNSADIDAFIAAHDPGPGPGPGPGG